MRRSLAVLTVVVTACALGAQATAAPPPPQQHTGPALPPQLSGHPSYIYQKYADSPDGCWVATANPGTRKVWAARLGCETTGRIAGLELDGLKPSQAINGATIVATIDVKQVAGAWSFVLSLHPNTETFGFVETPITHSGTYTLVSSPLALKLGQAYGVSAAAMANQSCGDACAIAFTINEIKWQLP